MVDQLNTEIAQALGWKRCDLIDPDCIIWINPITKEKVADLPRYPKGLQDIFLSTVERTNYKYYIRNGFQVVKYFDNEYLLLANIETNQKIRLYLNGQVWCKNGDYVRVC